MPKFIDLTGKVFGKLTVIERIKNNKKGIYWKCLCSCGKETVTRGDRLVKGRVISCGCYKKEVASKTKTVDLIGQKFGRLTVIERTGSDKNGVKWRCKCSCGNYIEVHGTGLRKHKSSSCGCYKKEVNSKFCHDTFTKHGETNTPLYGVWQSLKQRCLNPKNKAYKNYGSRKITVFPEWKNDFLSFKKWAEQNGYQSGLTIERIDNNGNYEPSNCTWIPLKEQATNRRSSHFVTFKGETHTITEWSEIIGINRRTLSGRINTLHWSIEKALTTPPSKRYKN
jgi:hypothetical protein